MSKLDDTLMLNQISTPGTHDTMAITGEVSWKGTASGRYVITQDMSLYNQLLAGIRFIDIRLEPQNGTLQVNHGVINLGTNLRTVLITCRHFLDVHPTEAIILSSQCEQSCEQPYHRLFYKAIEAAFPSTQLRSSRLYGYNEDWKRFKGFRKSKVIPSLKEIRGKIVFFNLNHNTFPGLWPNRIPTENPKTHENCYNADCAWMQSCRIMVWRDKCKRHGGIKHEYYERIDNNILNAASKHYRKYFYKTQVSAAALYLPGCFGSIRGLARYSAWYTVSFVWIALNINIESFLFFLFLPGK